MLNGTPKMVFSSTLEEPLTWANSRLVDGDAVEAVRSMKAADGPGLRTLGSLSLCRSLLAAGLVDRFRVVVFPVITGGDGSGEGVRRVSRCRLGAGREPPVRRPPAAAGVRADGARRSPTRRRALG